MYINNINYTKEFLNKNKYFDFMNKIQVKHNNLIGKYYNELINNENIDNNSDGIEENIDLDLDNEDYNNDNNEENSLLSIEEEKKLLYFLNYFKSMIFIDLILNDTPFKDFQDKMNYIIEITTKEENNIENEYNENFLDNEIFEEKLEEIKKEFFIIFSKEGDTEKEFENKEELEEDNNKEKEEKKEKKKKIKRISYETRNKLLKKILNKIYKYRNEILGKIKNNTLTVKEYEKYIKNITKLIININPTQYWFKKQLKIIENNIKENKCLYSKDICKKDNINTCIASIKYELEELKKILDIIVMFNIRLIIKYVRIYNNKVPSKLSFDDLKNIGIIGFIESTYKFDPFKNFKLSTYTTWWIKQNLIKNINQLRNSIVLPLYYTKIISKIEKYKKDYEINIDLQKKYKNFYEYLEKEHNISRKKIKKLESYMQTTNSISLNSSSKNNDETDDNGNLEDFLITQLSNLNNGNILEELEKEELINMLKEFINEPRYFNNKERYLIINSSYLFTDDVKTIGSLAIKLDRTKERLRQLQVEIYNKIVDLFPLYIKEKQQKLQEKRLKQEKENTDE